MGVEASYIGRPLFRVKFMPKSPFSGIPDQEWSYFFTKENLQSNSDINNITPIPSPWNGYRCTSNSQNYDNFLVDISGKRLEEATKKDGRGLIDTLSDQRVKDLFERRKLLKEKVTSAADNFFTWQTCENIFKISANNPAPIKFEDMLDDSSNAPKWTYVNKTKPDGTNASPLTPFMTQMTSSNTKGVHWGCQMLNSLALNQPFEILYYHDAQIHSVASLSEQLRFRMKGIISPEEEKTLDISKRAYLVIRWGVNTLHHFMVMFVQGLSPRLYMIANGNATLVDVFTDFSGEKLFNPNNTFLTFGFEPIGFGMLIYSNAFDGKYWVINSNGDNPIWIGAGPVYIGSGNIQCGFAIRPVQYLNGSFITSFQEISKYSGDERQPVLTTAMKGTGTNQASISTDENEEGSIHAVDCEKVNGSDILTFLEDGAKESIGDGLNRKIDFELIYEQDDETEGDSGVIGARCSAEVKLTPSDVVQGNGFVVKNGRSPYIWQLRGFLPQLDESSGDEEGGIDVSCDILSCDLSWNATSFTEFSYTGNIRALNFPRKGNVDFREYSNRSTYVEISARWQTGVGNNEFSKIFTGMTVGSNVENTVGQEVVSFQLIDYMNAMDGVKFVLSPYYDGMKASRAVRDIVRQSGLSDSKIYSGDSLISNLGDDPTEYGLPFVNPFEQPQFCFKTGSPLKAAILKIAELDLKTIYFDTDGNFHYDPIPGGIFNDGDTTAILDFVSSPKDTDDPTLVVWNMVSFGRGINDVYNVIQVNTVDKISGQPIITGVTYPPSIFNPSAEGYLGFRKHLIIQDPAIGGVDSANKYLDTYRSRVTKPPITFKFETFGRADIKPLAIITLDGQKARVMNISTRGEASSATWWMNVECEWFDAASQKEDSPAITNPGGNPDL